MRFASLLASTLLIVACGPSGKQVREPDEDDEDTTEVTEPTPVKPVPPPTTRPPRPAEGVAARLGDERQLDAEADIETSWQATVPVPAGWFVAEGPDLMRLQDPAREITIGVSSIEDVDNANVAITIAWKLLDPSFQLAVAQSVDLPGRDGWDAQTQVRYVTGGADQRLVVALARKKGTAWHVVTLDGKLAAVDRRGAQTSSIANDLKVPGLEIESYADNTASVDKAHLARFATFVDAARAQTGVPGAAIAIVHGGKIVFERGFGVQSIRTRKPVSASTRFLIGEATTPLTSLLIARLVDQGKLAWDAPLTGALPGFALADAEVAGQVQVQHTLCACTGLPRQDLELGFEFQGQDAEGRLASLAALRPTTGLGETFQYSRLMVAAGGWAASHAYAAKDKLGPGYERALRKLVLEPLHMRHTTFDFRKADGHGYAAPNGRSLNQTFVELPVGYEAAVAGVAPAAGAWSTVGDLSNYLLVELGQGKFRRKQIVSAAALLQRRSPQQKIDNESAYGLGLMITTDHGVTVLHQQGSTLGFTSDLFWLPDQDLGVVMLSNAGDATAFRAAVRQAFLEIAFDGRAQAQDQLTAALGASRTAALRESMLITPADAGFIGPLLGTWAAPGLGTITIAQQAGAYQLDAGEWTTGLAKKTAKDKSVKLVTTTPPYVGLELTPQGDGSLVLTSGQQAYTFARGAAAVAAPVDDEPTEPEAEAPPEE